MSNLFETHGAASWIELTTTDVAAAKAFYSEIAGWELEDNPMPDGGTYTVVKVNGEGIGGIMQNPPGMENMPPMWTPYLTVDDVDISCAQAQAAGGQVMREPWDVPGVGRMAVIADPTGGAICIMTYEQNDQAA